MDPEPADRAELEALVRAGNVEELRDRFSAPLQFGTAGLRGALGAGPNRMNRAVAIRAAAGLMVYLRDALEQSGDAGAAPVVAIGFDARRGSHRFALDTAAVVTAAGGRASIFPEPVPTPLLAFAVRREAADAGVMVTASHNPAGDNGYKVYLGGRVGVGCGSGAQIVPPADVEIAARIAAAPGAALIPRAQSGWSVFGHGLR
ncbi:MAG: hypothetical protein LBJ08_05245, partial [Bifidobacteriaceae bacterium]|nr:hypothetical protein [Bifidobacteriaceae bacterium]